MSATCSFVPTYSTMMFFSTTCSRRKWYLIGMYLVLECITGFFEILMALVLLQYIGMGSPYSTCISLRVCFIQRTSVQHDAVAIYSASAIDKDTDDYFLLNHATGPILISCSLALSGFDGCKAEWFDITIVPRREIKKTLHLFELWSWPAITWERREKEGANLR